MDEAPTALTGIEPDLGSPASRQFWAACNRGRLEMPRCLGCNAFRWYPQPICPYCHTGPTEWVALSGRGTLFSYTRVHRVFHPAMASWVPFLSVLVLPEEDQRARFVSRLVDYDLEKVGLNMPVEVVFQRLSAEVNLPNFRPVTTPS